MQNSLKNAFSEAFFDAIIDNHEIYCYNWQLVENWLKRSYFLNKYFKKYDRYGGISVKKPEPYKFSDLAKQVSDGIRTGHISVKKLGIDTSTAQRIYRMMRNDKYEGDMVFYVCNKICDEVLKDANRDAIRMFEWCDSLKFFDDAKKFIDLYIKERDRDILFCAVIGATIQATDKVGMKCFEMLSTLYQSLPTEA